VFGQRRKLEISIFRRFDALGQNFGVIVEFAHRLLHLLDLLPGDILELHAGQNIYKHAGELGAGFLDGVQGIDVMLKQRLVAVAQIA